MFHLRSYSENHTCLNDLVGVISWTAVLGNNDPGLVDKNHLAHHRRLSGRRRSSDSAEAPRRGMNDEAGSSMKFLEFLVSFGYRKCEIWQ